MIDVAELLRESIVIPDRREVWDWAAENIDFGNTTSFKGRYDINNVPWVREFLRACKDSRVREVTFVAPPQDSGKTKGAETYLAWLIMNSSCNMMWNTSTNVKAERWSDTRWEAMLMSVRGIMAKFEIKKRQKKKCQLLFDDGTFLVVQGAETEGNRSSDSVEVQINDEVHLWETPWLKEMHERTGSCRETKKILNISTGGKKKSELHERFLAGSQKEWHHVCPGCRGLIPYVFEHRDPRCNIRFDINAAILHADGRLDLREFAKTVLVNCPDPKCGRKFGYDRERLSLQNRGGIYIPQNPDADPAIESLHVNAFALGREPWHEILEPWVRLHIRGGVFAPEVLKEFITKKLAEFWDEKPFAVTTELKLAAWSRADCLRPGSWPDEVFRVMCCDNQRGSRGDIPHRWFVCVAFAADGRMRVIDAGRINEWTDLRKKQVELGVPDPTEKRPGPYVLVDRRWDPVEVDEKCALYKWSGAMGADQDEFIHPPWSQFAGTRQIFTEPRSIDIGFGTPEMGRQFALYHLFSSQRIQDLLANLRNAGKIEFPADTGTFCPEMATQFNSHKQYMEADRFGKERRVWKRIGDTPDHLYDCIVEAVMIGRMAGIYRQEAA